MHGFVAVLDGLDRFCCELRADLHGFVAVLDGFAGFLCELRADLHGVFGWLRALGLLTDSLAGLSELLRGSGKAVMSLLYR